MANQSREVLSDKLQWHWGAENQAWNPLCLWEDILSSWAWAYPHLHWKQTSSSVYIWTSSSSCLQVAYRDFLSVLFWHYSFPILARKWNYDPVHECPPLLGNVFELASSKHVSYMRVQSACVCAWGVNVLKELWYSEQVLLLGLSSEVVWMVYEGF